MSAYYRQDPTAEAMQRDLERSRARRAILRRAEKRAENDQMDLSSYFFRCAVSVVTYPMEFAKLLTQMGYEPIVPINARSFFGRPVLALPNTFQYLAYIKKVDGIFGCYRGLVAYLLYKSIYIYCCQSIAFFWDEGRWPWQWVDSKELERLRIDEFLEKNRPNPDGTLRALEPEEEPEEPVYNFKVFLKDLVRDLICRIGGVTISYPFLVIAVQQMAAFVGRERYMCRGVSLSMNHIWLVQGPKSYFNGLLPRLLGEAAGICMMGLATYLIRTHVKREEFQTCAKISLNVLTGALVYPFSVVSTTMMVNGSGLALGGPPFSPVYANWFDCWCHLQEKNVLRRGSSIVFRYYTGPTTINNGKLSPIGIHFGPDHTKTPNLRRF